ncbi:hypothetical protein [Geodermatophilus sp. URMC 64]
MFWDLVQLSGELGVLLWLAAALFWAAATAALASWLGRPGWQGALLGAALPVLGAVALLGLKGVRRARTGDSGPLGARRLPTAWGRSWSRAVFVAVASAAAIATAVATGLRDTEFGVDVGPASNHLWLSARDVGLTTVTIATVVALVVAAAGSWQRPRRWPAVLVAWCGAWWFVWAAGALMVGDTLRVLVDSAGLAAAVSAVVHVGASWTMLLALAGVLLAWSASGLLLVEHSPATTGDVYAAVPWIAPRAMHTPVGPVSENCGSGRGGVPANAGTLPLRTGDPFSGGW